MAQVKRASYRGETYFGRPVPNFGDPAARLLIVGLAPAAHGANRTGRMFTGDRSGDFLYRAMCDTGFANQPTSRHAGDGLQLTDALITAVAHCAPPDNKPLPDEIAQCSGFLDETFNILNPTIVLCLGRIAFDAVMRRYRRLGILTSTPAYKFAHGAEHAIAGNGVVLCSYHPSQQNTFTGRLTPVMLADVFRRAREILDGR